MKVGKDMLQQNNIYLFFIMQKVIQKSLRTTIIQQISRLNSINAEFYATLRKLNANQHRMNQTFNQRLEVMKAEIKNKIRQLSSNVDLMYQMMDRKILILIHQIQQNSAEPSLLQQQLRGAMSKIASLQQQLLENRNKYNALLGQNQYLKNKNIALVQQIESLNRKKNNTVTNDSSRNINPKTDINEDPQISLGNYLSPLQQPSRTNLHCNDLTFNKNLTSMTNFNNINKKIKSQENSFSSLLLKQQNSFDPSYGSEKPESKKLNFGCMPVRQQQQVKIQFGANSILKNSQCGKDQGHRMSFLINNLRDSNNQSMVSQQNSRFQYSGQEINGKSVLSRGAVKKYHI